MRREQGEEIERQRKEEDKRVWDLFGQADIWMKSQQLREYLEVFRSTYIRKNGEIVPGGEVDAWLKWAER